MLYVFWQNEGKFYGRTLRSSESPSPDYWKKPGGFIRKHIYMTTKHGSMIISVEFEDAATAEESFMKLSQFIKERRETGATPSPQTCAALARLLVRAELSYKNLTFLK